MADRNLMRGLLDLDGVRLTVLVDRGDDGVGPVEAIRVLADPVR